MELSHNEGFEDEAKYWEILGEALKDCPALKSDTVMRIIAYFAPEYISSLFRERPCVRKLKYIGHHWCEDKHLYDDCPDNFFRIGEEYESLDFNGSTYTISGYEGGEGRIGYAYFERIT